MKTKNELLDLAIERINEYDKIDKSQMITDSVDKIGYCGMCTHISDDCKECPHNFSGGRDLACRDYGNDANYWQNTPVEKHQANLIKGLKAWAEKNTDFIIERVK